MLGEVVVVGKRVTGGSNSVYFLYYKQLCRSCGWGLPIQMASLVLVPVL